MESIKVEARTINRSNLTFRHKETGNTIGWLDLYEMYKHSELEERVMKLQIVSNPDPFSLSNIKRYTYTLEEILWGDDFEILNGRGGN